ncbi:HAD family hydrolase [Shimia thalassica]|uniref:HAD family hydrolase n=1 Tax=Shimia thalassica TaxID=1715693 RepID=UPI001C0963F8|nr:HAD family hydrolase [Shimia thalassica]MBU2943512.1 HAD family hydrolase [Shimia thalassica]MDO6501582.1 HAD family hydrolase [Shimia thalassica]
MTKNLTTIGFDADDTLWHNERFFRITQDRFAELLADYVAQDHLEQRLLEAEKRNVGHYGFGIKGFVLSMIETAIEVTDEKVPASVIAELMAAGREMLRHPIELLPHVRDVVEQLGESHRLVLITKGDLLDQERKLAQSGLGDFFDWVEIVSNKTAEIYQTTFAQQGDGPQRAMMVGNSMKSDVVPAIKAGSWGVYIPHGQTWELEFAEAPEGEPRYSTLDELSNLPDLVRDIG